MQWQQNRLSNAYFIVLRQFIENQTLCLFKIHGFWAGDAKVVLVLIWNSFGLSPCKIDEAACLHRRCSVDLKHLLSREAFAEFPTRWYSWAERRNSASCRSRGGEKKTKNTERSWGCRARGMKDARVNTRQLDWRVFFNVGMMVGKVTVEGKGKLCNHIGS